MKQKRDLFAGDITLNEEDHTYHVDGYPHLEWTSATTFIHHFFSGFDAEAVAEELAGSSSKKYGHMSQEEILEKWDDIADTGTMVHNQLEDWIDEVIMGDKDEIPLTHVKSEHGVAWLEENIMPQHELYPEVKVYSLPLQIAGTVDLLIYDPDTDKWIIADWKTNSKIRTKSYGNEKGTHNATKYLDDCNYNHYQLQMSLYQWILKEEYGIDIHKRILLHLRPKQTRYYPLGVKEFWTDYLRVNVEKMVKKRLKDKEEGKLFNPLPKKKED